MNRAEETARIFFQSQPYVDVYSNVSGFSKSLQLHISFAIFSISMIFFDVFSFLMFYLLNYFWDRAQYLKCMSACQFMQC